MKFKNCAELYKEKVSPEELDPNTKYIGLEHIGENTLSLNGFGFASDVNSSKSVFKKGDILFGKLRPYFRKVVVAPFNGICSTDIWVVKPINGIDKNFLFYWMASQDFIDEVTRASEGTRMPRAKWEVASKITIPDVDSEKQIKIGKILYALDQKIHLNRQINQTLEAIGQAFFKSWFVDFDPVQAKVQAKEEGYDPERAAMAAIAGISLENSPEEREVALNAHLEKMTEEQSSQLAYTASLFPDGFYEYEELGKVPKEWEMESLFDQAEFINGAAFRGKDFCKPELGLPIIKIAELKSGINNQTKFTSKEVKSKYHINSGDILFSWSGNPKTSIDVFIWSGRHSVLNQHIFNVVSQNKIYKVFNYYLLRSLLPFFKRTASNKQTTGLGHITQKDLKKKLIAKPQKIMIEAFFKKAEPLFDMYYNNLLKINSLTRIRDTLLPKLISGEIEA